MPVKWSPDMDQLLLVKMMETHDLKVDANKVISAWPTDRGDIPTARAITERLVKIRQQATGKKGASSSGHFGIAAAQTKGTSTTTNTPRKNASSPATKGTKTPASAAANKVKKRKLATAASDAEDDDEDLTKTPKPVTGYGVPPLNFANIPSLTPTRNTTQTPRSVDAKTPTTSGRSSGARHNSRADSQATLSDAGTPTPRGRRAASMKLSATVKQEQQEQQEMEGSESGHGMESPAESDVSEYVV
ncbi:hypothetical protein W97_08876 [Coniosporium apollinis CBS 100218]|uniref:Uncharacterized protein n=1 Tax=Coniosporium apollinis (strain CBS 100218) TaxID=1168221 RepID=R7Z6T4_CONA1|nr:uncharacterized protein W97_08876 [Coniosporium apollinis CBS 100218]EON69616.1 hypothetical protein W97_08876 [Coniosporium apollinis CBS 100218]